MAISGISSFYTPLTVQQHANAQRVQQIQAAKQDSDGDNDGSRFVGVERNDTNRTTPLGTTLGSLINVKV